MPLRPETWPRVKEVFEGARALSTELRAEYLATACGGDAALREEVERLLAAHDRATHFLETPAVLGLADSGVRKSLTGQRIGPYQLLSRIGTGGMGEVYEARDTRLDRTVAMKVMPARLADDPQARERFEREARAIAALNHPHICTLHDVGTHEGIAFFVMEYLDGETLAARLAKGPIALDRALEYAVQIASALDTAHGAGIAHRDLKPGNVMLTKNGAMLLDFGLAKAFAPIVGAQPARVPAPELTTPGTILGTVQYMAPEQIEGNEADARTDIFAFGAVFFEMVTGRKAFEGKSQASLIAAILEREPPRLSSLLPDAPPFLDGVLKRCLAKDPDDRWQSARGLMLELESLRAPSRSRERLGWVAAAGLLVAVAVLVALRFSSAVQEPQALQPSRLTDNLASDAMPDWSPDGRRIAFVSARGGKADIYVMDADGRNPTNLTNNPATDASPAWSPDGKLIAFESDRSPGPGIYIMSADGSSPRRLVDVRAQGGRPAWAPDGRRIAFMSGPERECEIYVISTDGTGLTQLTHNDLFDGDPGWSPDGKSIAFTHSADDGDLEIYVMDAAGADQRRLTVSPGYDGAPIWSPDGARIAFHSTRDGGASEIYVMGADGSDPARITHNGKSDGEVSWSPDGTKLAFQSGRAGNDEIYVAEAIPDTARQCTSGAAHDRSPSWSPDGSRLLFSSNRESPSGIYVAACGASPVRVDTGPGAVQQAARSPRGDKIAFASDRDGHYDVYVLAGRSVTNLTHGYYRWAGGMAWSPDGARLALSVVLEGGRDIVILDAAGGFVRRIAHGARTKGDLAWSPDGSLIAFAAGPHDDSPFNFEIYVIRADGSDVRRLTTHSAYDVQPTWSPDGRRIAFLSERSGGSDVYVMNADGSGLTRVTHTPWAEDRPAWSPDGRHLALASSPNGNFDIYVYDLADLLRVRF